MISDSNINSNGKEQVIKFVNDDENSPEQVLRSRIKVIRFDEDNEDSKDLYTQSNESNYPEKAKQQVIRFVSENESTTKNKVEKSVPYKPVINQFNDDIKFITANNGHLYLSSNEGIFELCNFYILPIRIIIKDNGLYHEIFYKLKCILENGQEEKVITISSFDLNEPKWIVLKLGIKYYMCALNNAYPLLKMYLSKKFRSISQEYQYDMVGWKCIDSKYFYLHENGAIGSVDSVLKGSIDKRIEVDASLDAFSALKGALTLLNLSSNLEKTLPLLLYSHLSVLTELFTISGARPKFVLWVYGLTGSMKTSVCVVFFILFNRVSKPEIPATFKDTPSAIELKAFAAKDCTLLVDDYHPTTSPVEKRNMEALASHILRMYGDGITKSRATKTMEKQKEYPPRGLCVITGEDRLGGESTVARYIGIEVEPGDYNTDILSYHQNNPLIYSTHMYYFIQWISYNFSNICDFIRGSFSKYRNESINLFRHKRFSECYAIFRIVSEILLNYCIAIKYFDHESAHKILLQWNEVIYQTIKLHENSNINQDPAIMYLIAINELVSSNKCILSLVGEPNTEKQNIIGFKDKDFYYLIPNTAFIAVRNFWKGQGIEFPVSTEQVNKALDILKTIETSIESGKIRRTVKCNPSGKSRGRYLKIYINKMNEIINTNF